ncbi:hypothetical protein C5167_011827 [Papaver somniferum]|uniref:uncharacterized protein LOC113327509 n=1 Tax=Papaver somniferum TaxID=3469 RepID=UPI000E6FC332|nr:uncharacterized protein LOC113327509 [Papaver somniferum]RZC85198.1 hypothetical protein C5167_011827 [Papaver somniferum]
MSMSTLKAWREVLDINTQDPEVLKPQFLLKLYDLLISLSLDSVSQFPGEKLTDIRKISNFLFEELSRRFEHFFSNVGQGVLCSDSWGLLQDLTLLLRCCISMLHLLEFDLSLLIEKCKILLSILGKLCSPELASYVGRKGTNVISVKESTSRECTIAGEDCITSVVEEYETFMCFVQKSRASIPVLRSIVEVFINEFLVHKKLRDYFIMVDSISSTSDKLFMSPLNLGSSNVLLELLSSHFLLSVSDQPTFQNSFENFLLLSDEKPHFLDLISLNAAMQLLSTVLIYSPPQILQAYIIFLVCGRSSINMASEDQASEPRLVNWCFSAFEISMELYSRNMSSLQLGDDHEEPGSGSNFIKKQCTAGGLSHLSFESHIRPVMYSQLKAQTANFAKSSHDLASKTKSDLMDTCTAYIKENQNILNESYRDESFVVLCYIISMILSGDIRANRLWKKGIISQQEMYLLASTVNLMSSSLLQIIWCMQKRSLGNPKILKDYSQCKEYDMIISIISCFQQCSISQPMTTLVMDMMAQFPARHKFSKMMFMHFAGLLLFSFEAGYAFLSKGCILMLMTLTNLFIFEEGNLDALKQAPQPSNKSLVVFSPRISSRQVASNFKKFQRCIIRINEPIQSEASKSSLINDGVEQFGPSTMEENNCNSQKQLNLKRMLGNTRHQDYDELADFVEFKEGKDYSKYEKNRKKYRKYVCGKKVGYRKERRRRLRAILT